MNKFIVFSDLDGTLLDHHTYQWEKALPGLKLLSEKKTPLILVSSKTLEEMSLLHESLGLSGPFIFENGGGIAWGRADNPNDNDPSIEITGKSSHELERLFPEVEKLLKIEGTPLTKMNPEEISRRTGLPLERAALARLRRASLPFVINKKERDIDLELAGGLLKKTGLSLTKGGRFYHLMDSGSSKGRAIEIILDRIKTLPLYENERKIISAGIGDSENDISMLRAVDVPFLVKRHNGVHLKTDIPGIRLTEKTGPEGFTEAIKSLWT